MKLGKAFTEDLQEAFEFFKKKQLVASGNTEEARIQLDKVPLEKWVTMLLKKPVYELIGEKRVDEDE